MGENALEKVKVALAIIDHLAKQEWSPEQECMLRASYYILSWQCSPLGVGIDPLWEGTVERILSIAENFKLRLSHRYPGWQSRSSSEFQMDTPLLEFKLDAKDEDGFWEEREKDGETEVLTSVVTISQDCQCTDHTGPHWLYEDYHRYQCNLVRLERCAEHIQRLSELSLPPEDKSIAGYIGWLQRQRAKTDYRTFIIEERLRWQEKLWHMEDGKINAICYQVLGSDFQDLDRRKRTLIVRIRDMLEKMIEAEESYTARSR